MVDSGLVDTISNPYTPGAGVRPHELVGREASIAAFDTATVRAQMRRPSRSPVLYGLRGVGKTVLLRELAAHARRRNWLVISAEAKAGEAIMPTLTREIFKELRQAGRTRAGTALDWVRSVFAAFSVKADPVAGTYTFGLDIAPATGWADTGDTERDLGEMLVELAAFAGSHGAGVLLAIDELQDVDTATLRAINTTVHRLGQDREPVPFLFAGAGLPSLRGLLAEATSYAERLYEYVPIGPLPPAAAAAALANPAAAYGVQWTHPALTRAGLFSAGYPYFIQVLGQHTWNLAIGPTEITREDVDAAITDAQQSIDSGLYMSRWQRATRAEQGLLAAMAQLNPDGSPSRMSELVTTLGKQKLSQLSPRRSSLIAKGMVYAPDRGEIAFTVPGMTDFVARQVLE